MPQFHRSSCRLCEKPDEPGDRISGIGLCRVCGERRHLEHNAQMKAHAGPWFDYWRARSLAALGVPVLDAPQPPR